MTLKYGDIVEKDELDRVVRITSYDGSYDVFVYGASSNKAERIDSYTKEGKPIDSVVFYRDAQNGQLLAFRKSNLNAFFAASDDDTNVFLKGTDEKFNTFNTFFSSLVIPGDESGFSYKYTNDDTLEVNHNNSVSVYDKNGKILRNDNLHYIYDDTGNLSAVEDRDKEGKVLKRTNYESAVEKSIEYFDSGVISRRVVLNVGGNTEEYYENGIMYAVAHYFDDNKKVKSIEYVK